MYERFIAYSRVIEGCGAVRTAPSPLETLVTADYSLPATSVSAGLVGLSGDHFSGEKKGPRRG
jgi:hypothetical protein